MSYSSKPRRNNDDVASHIRLYMVECGLKVCVERNLLQGLKRVNLPFCLFILYIKKIHEFGLTFSLPKITLH